MSQDCSNFVRRCITCQDNFLFAVRVSTFDDVSSSFALSKASLNGNGWNGIEMFRHDLYKLLEGLVRMLLWSDKAFYQLICFCTATAEQDRSLFSSVVHSICNEVLVEALCVSQPILRRAVKLCNPSVDSHLFFRIGVQCSCRHTSFTLIAKLCYIPNPGWNTTYKKI